MSEKIKSCVFENSEEYSRVGDITVINKFLHQNKINFNNFPSIQINKFFINGYLTE